MKNYFQKLESPKRLLYILKQQLHIKKFFNKRFCCLLLPSSVWKNNGTGTVASCAIPCSFQCTVNMRKYVSYMCNFMTPHKLHSATSTNWQTTITGKWMKDGLTQQWCNLCTVSTCSPEGTNDYIWPYCVRNKIRLDDFIHKFLNNSLIIYL